MGFFGLFLLARTDRPLETIPDVKAVGAPVRDRQRDGGWRVGQIHCSDDVQEPDALAAALVRDTAVPALAMYVVDSDWAQVSCDSPGGVRHTFLLDPVSALAQFMPWDEPPPPPPAFEDTVAILERWSREAGLTPSPERLLAVLPQSPGPFGEGVDLLFAALGIPDLAG